MQDWTAVPAIKFVLPNGKLSSSSLNYLDHLDSEDPILQWIEALSKPIKALSRDVKSNQAKRTTLRDWMKSDSKFVHEAYEVQGRKFDEYLSSFTLRLYLSGNARGRVDGVKLGCRNGRDFISFHLMSVILALLTEGKMWSLRRCVRCNLWMQARQKNQAYCDRACRQAAFQAVPSVREKRNADRRKRYREELKRNSRWELAETVKPKSRKSKGK